MSTINSQLPPVQTEKPKDPGLIGSIINQGAKLTQGLSYATIGTAALTAGLFMMYTTGMSVKEWAVNDEYEGFGPTAGNICNSTLTTLGFDTFTKLCDSLAEKNLSKLNPGDKMLLVPTVFGATAFAEFCGWATTSTGVSFLWKAATAVV